MRRLGKLKSRSEINSFIQEAKKEATIIRKHFEVNGIIRDLELEEMLEIDDGGASFQSWYDQNTSSFDYRQSVLFDSYHEIKNQLCELGKLLPAFDGSLNGASEKRYFPNWFQPGYREDVGF